MRIEPHDPSRCRKLACWCKSPRAPLTGVIFLWEVYRQTLPPRERVVLLCRSVLGFTLRKTGEQLGVSKERVRQMEYRAYRRMRLDLFRLRAIQAWQARILAERLRCRMPPLMSVSCKHEWHHECLPLSVRCHCPCHAAALGATG